MEIKGTFSVTGLEDKVKFRKDNHDIKNGKVGRLKNQPRKL